MHTYRSLIISILFLLQAAGCVSFLQPLEVQPAVNGAITTTGRKLMSLPKPAEKIVAAVYKFRDQTGQYKQSSTGSTFSTAVSQGATSILIQVLEESGWYIPIEREGLSNLLNERKIIRSSRAEFLGNKEGVEDNSTRLPPLLFAGIIIEGGVISYESNLLTGGAGVKYFGVGGSEEYRIDRVTVYLRAVSSQNGRILKTIHTSKTILSQAGSAGIYRFVDYQRLLEAETGFSYNEPPEICLREALEKAVQSLIIEGVFDNLWGLKDPSEASGPAIRQYLAEKRISENLDPAGLRIIPSEGVRFGIAVGQQEFRGDYNSSKHELPLSAELEYRLPGQAVALGARGAYLNRELPGVMKRDVISVGVMLKYYMMDSRAMQPYLAAGAEYVMASSAYADTKTNESAGMAIVIPLRGGVRYRIDRHLDVTLETTFVLGLNDSLDGLTSGKWNDYTMGLSLGAGWTLP